MNKFLYIILVSTMGAETLQALYDLRWMMAFIAWLVIMDFWVSVSSLHRNKQPIGFWREIKRACNRMTDYIAYLISGAILGLAIFEPLSIADHTATAAAGLAMGCIWEIESVVNKICSMNGAGHPLDVKRIIKRILKEKFKWLSED